VARDDEEADPLARRPHGADDVPRAGRIAGQVRPDIDDVNRRLGHDPSLSGARSEKIRLAPGAL
jgi:hypothetical protein